MRGIRLLTGTATAGCNACMGNELVVCEGSRVLGADCEAIFGAGHACVTPTGFGGDCLHPDCRGSPPGFRCEGNRVVGCAGVRIDRECLAGTVCTEDGGTAHCTGTGEPCTEARCEGDVAVLCVGGRYGPRQDCGAAGGACVGGPSAVCEAVGAECDVRVSRCDGDVLEYCTFSGMIARFDCAAHGYRGCRGSGSAYCLAPDV